MRDTVSDMAHSATLLVGIAAFAADPTGLTLGGALASGTLSLKELFRPSNPAARQLAKDIAADLKAGLTAPTFHMPADGPRLLPQMIEKALPDPAEIVGQNLNPDALLGVMLNKLTDPDHRRADMAEAFCNLLRPSLTRLLGDRVFVQSIAPLIAKETLARLSALADALVVLSTTYGSLAKSLENLESLHRTQLEALALRFGLNPDDRVATADLLSLLSQKSKEHQALLLEIQSLKGMSARIDNIHAAALDATKNLRFEEAVHLVRAAKEIHQQDILRPALETNAKLVETEAEIELLRNRPEQAFAILSGAADSFHTLDVLLPAKMRNNYAQIMIAHAKTFGGSGLSFACDLVETGIRSMDKTEDPLLWADLHNTLAIALRNKGSREAGAEAIKTLGLAADAYDAALSVCTREAYPHHWAMTLQNRAGVLQTIGVLLPDIEGRRVLIEAIGDFRDALIIRTREKNPRFWASTMHNIGTVLENLGRRSEEQAAVDYLSDAITTLTEVLTERRRDDDPFKWAETKNSLAAAFQDRGERLNGMLGLTDLSSAARHAKEALEVFSPDTHPVGWATLQELLAWIECALAQNSLTKEPFAHWTLAINHIDKALEIYDFTTFPRAFQRLQSNRTAILARLP